MQAAVSRNPRRPMSSDLSWIALCLVPLAGVLASPLWAVDGKSAPPADLRKLPPPKPASAFRIQNTLAGGPYRPGDRVNVLYEVVNISKRDLPANELPGLLQHWIERLGPNPKIEAMPARIGRSGSKYAAGGAIMRAFVGPGKGVAKDEAIQVTKSIDTTGYPPGRYRYYIDYRLAAVVLHNDRVEFELVAAAPQQPNQPQAASAEGKKQADLPVPVKAEGQALQVATAGPLTLKGHTSAVLSVAFSPDGKRLASASGDQTVRVWDTTSGQQALALRGHIGEVKCVAFSSDGSRLASCGGDKTVKVWDATSGQETFTLKGHTDVVFSVAFSPDGKRLASGSGDRGGGKDQTIKVWDATSGKETLTLKGHAKAVSSVAFSPDGKCLASGSSDMTVKVWDAMSGQETLTLKGNASNVSGLAISPDGKRLAIAGSAMWATLWDANTGQNLLILKGHNGFVRSVAFSPDGKWLATASWDQTVKVWDVATGQELVTLRGHTGFVQGVAFSPDGKRLASASHDTTVKVWDLSPVAGRP